MNEHFSSKNFTLGILGGGQLGRMLIQKAHDFNVSTAVMDADADAPCKYLCERFINADFKNYDAVYAFGKTVSLLTVEIEHVNVDALQQLELEGLKVYPQPAILKLVQDKGLQKQFYRINKIPTASFKCFADKAELMAYDGKFPVIQKLRTEGYDGKGVMKLNSKADLKNGFEVPSIIEECIDFEKEISVIVSRNAKGEMSNYPVVEMEFNAEANLVEFLISPANISQHIENDAIQIARDLISKLELVGLLAVEMFVTKNGNVLVNEIAPRPHNSGHQSIEGNVTSQFEQHLRAILNLPPGDTSIIQPSVMVNILGEKGFTGEANYKGIEEVLQLSGTHIHFYGKKMTKPFRKMGHVTITDANKSEAIRKAKFVKEKLIVVSDEVKRDEVKK